MQRTSRRDQEAGFSFRFGQTVRVVPPHPDAGATGTVTNAYLFQSGREEVFVCVPGGIGRYEAWQLEPAPVAARAAAQAAARPHHGARAANLVLRLLYGRGGPLTE